MKNFNICDIVTQIHKLMKKRAFITGGTGFLGIHILQLLTAQNWEVWALHRPTSNLKYIKALEVQLVKGSITDKESLLKAMPENVEAVFHVAGNTSLWKKKNKEQYQDNVIGTKNMVEVALLKKAQKFVQTSSISAFGVHNTQIDENTVSNAPNTFLNYHKTKYLAELEVEKGIEKGLEAVIINPNHILGAYDTHNWTQLIHLTAKGKLAGIPPGIGMYGYVKDVAQAHIQAVSKGKTGQRYLLGGVQANFLEVINTIEQILDKPLSKKTTPTIALKLMMYLGKIQGIWSKKEPQITPEKYALLTEYSICDDTKARTELDYQHTPLEVMLKEACDWLKKEDLL